MTSAKDSRNPIRRAKFIFFAALIFAAVGLSTFAMTHELLIAGSYAAVVTSVGIVWAYRVLRQGSRVGRTFNAPPHHMGGRSMSLAARSKLAVILLLIAALATSHLAHGHARPNVVTWLLFALWATVDVAILTKRVVSRARLRPSDQDRAVGSLAAAVMTGTGALLFVVSGQVWRLLAFLSLALLPLLVALRGSGPEEDTTD
jgi:hypothetical protein